VVFQLDGAYSAHTPSNQTKRWAEDRPFHTHVRSLNS
jgi:hypothetical protein